MSDPTDKYSPKVPLEKLKPVEALALVNRWAKSNRLQQADRDALYDLKDRKLAEFLKHSEVALVAVIIRESPTIGLMRQAIATQGELIYLNFFDRESLMDTDELQHLEILENMASCEFEVDYPADICYFREQHFQADIERYLAIRAERHSTIKQYDRQLNKYNLEKQEAAKAWAEEHRIYLKKVRDGKTLEKGWNERLEKQGFSYDRKPPEHPFPNQKLYPPGPPEPETSYYIGFDNYVPGSLPEVDKAIAWAESILSKTFSHPSEISVETIEQIEENLRDSYLQAIKESVLDIFKRVISGELTDAKEIWKELTAFEVDYSDVIGMYQSSDIYNRIQPSNQFGRWHEINLSPTGYWLVELQSTFNSSITFHIPFDRYHKLKLNIDLGSLPKIQSSDLSFGRSISPEEANQYPLKKLLKILGSKPTDFPCRLEELSARDYEDFDELEDDE